MNYELHEGDCLVEMAKIADGSVDMALLDLPFGTTSNEWDSIIPMDKLWIQLKRITRPHGAIVMFGVQPFTSLLVTSHLKGYKHRWVWNKQLAGNFAVTQYMPLTIDEDILVFTRSGESVNYYPIMRKGKLREKGSKSTNSGRGFGGLKPISNISDDYHPVSILNFPNTDRSHSLHPSQKNIDLLAYLIQTYTKPNETVIDCTFGSCGSGVAAMRTRRRFIGIEQDAGYFAIGSKQIEDAARAAAGQPKILQGSASDFDALPMFSEMA